MVCNLVSKWCWAFLSSRVKHIYDQKKSTFHYDWSSLLLDNTSKAGVELIKSWKLGLYFCVVLCPLRPVFTADSAGWGSVSDEGSLIRSHRSKTVVISSYRDFPLEEKRRKERVEVEEELAEVACEGDTGVERKGKKNSGGNRTAAKNAIKQTYVYAQGIK